MVKTAKRCAYHSQLSTSKVINGFHCAEVLVHEWGKRSIIIKSPSFNVWCEHLGDLQTIFNYV